MGDAARGGSPADTDHPFTEDRSVDQRLPPERLGDPIGRACDGANGIMGNEAHLGRRQCPQAVVHLLDVERMQIRNIAGNMQRKDLTLAIPDNLVSADQAFDDEATLLSPLAFTDDILMAIKLPDIQREAEEHPPIFRRERGNRFELLDQRGEVIFFFHGLAARRPDGSDVRVDRVGESIPFCLRKQSHQQYERRQQEADTIGDDQRPLPQANAISRPQGETHDGQAVGYW